MPVEAAVVLGCAIVQLGSKPTVHSTDNNICLLQRTSTTAADNPTWCARGLGPHDCDRTTCDIINGHLCLVKKPTVPSPILIWTSWKIETRPLGPTFSLALNLHHSICATYPNLSEMCGSTHSRACFHPHVGHFTRGIWIQRRFIMIEHVASNGCGTQERYSWAVGREISLLWKVRLSV